MGEDDLLDMVMEDRLSGMSPMGYPEGDADQQVFDGPFEWEEDEEDEEDEDEWEDDEGDY